MTPENFGASRRTLRGYGADWLSASKWYPMRMARHLVAARPAQQVGRATRHTRGSGAGLGIKRHKPGFFGKARLVFGWFLGEGSDGDAKPVSGINRGVRGGLEMVVGSVV